MHRIGEICVVCMLALLAPSGDPGGPNLASPDTFPSAIERAAQGAETATADRGGCSLIDFEGLGEGAPVGTISGTPNVIFGPSWRATVDADAGGSGNFANEPSADTVVSLLITADDEPIDFDAPVQSVELFYSANGFSLPITLTAWDCVGGTGVIVDTAVGNTVGTASGGAPCSGDPFGDFCLWDTLRVSSTSVGIRSVVLSGGASRVFGLDDLTFCLSIPVTGACCVNQNCIVTTPTECAVQGGAYQEDDLACAAGLCDSVTSDCNANGFWDGCELDCGSPCGPCFDVPGCGQDGDCNNNGFLDTCDIDEFATSEDCDGNRVPDECEFVQEVTPPLPWDLAVLLDGSGSVSSIEFGLMIDGLVEAILDPEVIEPTGLITLTVIQFAGGLVGGAVVEIPPTNIDSAQTAADVAALVVDIAQARSGTPMGEAIDLAVATILPGRPDALPAIMLLTDGVATSTRDPVLAANDAVLAGVEEINAIAVGGLDTTELELVVRPQPNSPGPPPSPGFVVHAASFQEIQASFGAILGSQLDTLHIVTRAVAPADVGQPYHAEFQAANACGPDVWSVTSGQLPEGLTFDADGAMSGTAQRCGTEIVEISLTDLTNTTVVRSFTIVTRDALEDGDTDLEDFARFQRCYAGPNVPVTDADCVCFDTDDDQDIDLDDFFEFQSSMAGP